MGIGIEMNIILAYAFGLILLYFLGWLFIVPIKMILKLMVNAIIGGLLLVLFNFIGGFLDFAIGLNPINALIVGFLGVPGLILLVVLKLVL